MIERRGGGGGKGLVRRFGKEERTPRLGVGGGRVGGRTRTEGRLVRKRSRKRNRTKSFEVKSEEIQQL